MTANNNVSINAHPIKHFKTKDLLSRSIKLQSGAIHWGKKSET
jgi:hypothetical protein